MLRILAAEGNHINRYFLERALSRMGYGVTSVGEARSALFFLGRDYFHVALLDMRLNGLWGPNGLGRLLSRRDASLPLCNPRVKILGMGDPGLAEPGDGIFLHTLDGMLPKPVDGGQLAAQIIRLTASRRSSRSDKGRRKTAAGTI